MFDFSHDNQQPSPLLEQLSPKVRKCLLSRAQKKSFTRGQTICLQDEPSRKLKIVLEGWVKLYRVSPSGHEAMLAMLTNGQSFDEISALRGAPSAANVEAVSDCEILYLDISAVCACHNAAHEIAVAVLSAASSHLHEMMHEVEELKVLTGYERLCNFLVRLSDKQGGQSRLELPFDKVVLASMLGMKPESLSRAFGKLRNVGVESEYKSVVIRDLERLKSVVA
ncbi:Crp/Fnr family transcriptional regulator [Ruegeria arenilitoris]|uniref:Crp/Fnr family transcriptional regulator n=1 Tax=Ruegeria arenilitoris TaxID=1173585 RepID=UPI00147AB76C|nr:Crp/Fnr family transcriptional regulator [Ruegeria arenilitoris]